MNETKTKLEQEKEKTKENKNKDEAVVKEMELHFPDDEAITHILKDEGVDGERIERFLTLTGLKVLARINFKKGTIKILDIEADVEDRKKQFIAEKIVKRIKPALERDFPKMVQAILSEEEEEWQKKILAMIDKGAEVTMERTRGKCVWVIFKKGRSVRRLLIE